MLFDSYGEYVFYDGAMGTMLQRRGLEPGLRPDVMNITAPDVVEGVYRLYLEAGSEIICTNTFGANADALRHTGHSPEDIIATGVSIARRAAERAFEENVIRNGVGGSASATTRAAKVALDIGPIGKLMEPMGDLEYEGAYDLFKQQAIAGENAGADLAAIETMSDITEMKAAISAIVENTNLPVFATMTFGASGKTYLGFSAEDFAKTAESAGADAIGIN
ncbi:MAG: homocysteine S-methyltransferase family protein, partial [Oscillospiraceae bacterium]|nr:homocysteine S-methyltransferase family protein [Oscillospiraceae bacterium]